ncbi:MAG: hypothetical protein MR727_03550 [Lentisphaeria bacterium]|nr:hypothetical protein [Lentisphaeria bacterium]
MNIKETVVCLAAGILVLTVGTAAVQRNAQWKSATCTANLKTLHQAMFAYANDHDNAIVPVAYEIRPRWTFWHDYIRKYLKEPRVLYCPANPRAEKQFADDDDDLVASAIDQMSISYGMNYALGATVKAGSQPSRDYRFANVKNPEHVVCIGDAKSLNPRLRGTKYCWKEDYAPIHEEKTLLVFVDGHVEAMDKENLGMMDAFDGWKQDTSRWVSWK